VFITKIAETEEESACVLFLAYLRTPSSLWRLAVSQLQLLQVRRKLGLLRKKGLGEESESLHQSGLIIGSLVRGPLAMASQVRSSV
jgi:hypothetical protein